MSYESNNIYELCSCIFINPVSAEVSCNTSHPTCAVMLLHLDDDVSFLILGWQGYSVGCKNTQSGF